MISASASEAVSRIATVVGALNVRVTGAGPVALLWHSLFIDSSSWDRLVPALARHRRLVVVDGPGHGGSGDPGRRYTMSECATAAVEVLEGLGLEGPVDWLGNAWGGHVGIVAAVEHPARIRSLITLSTPVRPYSAKARREVRLLTAAYRLLGPMAFLIDGVAEVQLSTATRAHDPVAVALQLDFLRGADRRRLCNAIQSVSIHRDDLTAHLGRIGVPTLFVTGTEHTDFLPDEARATIARVPDGRVEIVADAAKLVPLEQPARTAEIVVRFWTAVS